MLTHYLEHAPFSFSLTALNHVCSRHIYDHRVFLLNKTAGNIRKSATDSVFKQLTELRLISQLATADEICLQLSFQTVKSQTLARNDKLLKCLPEM